MSDEGNRDLVIDFNFRYAKFKVCVGSSSEMYSMHGGIWVWISGETFRLQRSLAGIDIQV